MSDEAILATINQSGSSDYLLYASYGASRDNSIKSNLTEFTEHRFSAHTPFPQLGEYTKINLHEVSAFPSIAIVKKGLASLSLVEASGSFKNVLGHYQVDKNGTIHSVDIAFNNTREKQSESKYQFQVNADQNIHFFVVANGYSLNKEFSDTKIENGGFSFIYKLGEDEERLAQITDNSDDITLVYIAAGEDPKEIRGPVYHTTNDESQNNVNADSHQHALSGMADEETDTVLRIGFEDLPGLGDADFNDVVVDLKVVYAVASSNDNTPSQEMISNQETVIPLYDTGDDTFKNGLDNFDGMFSFQNDVPDVGEGKEDDLIDFDDVLILVADPLEKIIHDGSIEVQSQHMISQANLKDALIQIDEVLLPIESQVEIIV